MFLSPGWLLQSHSIYGSRTTPARLAKPTDHILSLFSLKKESITLVMGSSSTEAHAPISPSVIFYTQRGPDPCRTLRRLCSTLCCLQLYLLFRWDYHSNFCCPMAFSAILCSPTGCRQQSPLPSVSRQYPGQLVVSHWGHQLSLMLKTGM